MSTKVYGLRDLGDMFCRHKLGLMRSSKYFNLPRRFFWLAILMFEQETYPPATDEAPAVPGGALSMIVISSDGDFWSSW
jgi:hypothetical protein